MSDRSPGQPGLRDLREAKLRGRPGGQERFPTLWQRVIPLFLLCLAGLLDYLTGPAIEEEVLYLAAAAAGGWLGGNRSGLVIACLAWVIGLAMGDARIVFGPAPSLILANVPLTLASLLGASWLGAFLHEQQRILAQQRDSLARAYDQLAENLRTARTVQELLTGPPPAHQAVEIGLCLKPARVVGGDTADLWLTPEGRLAFTVADVSGRGIPAALVAAALIGMLQDAPERHHSPGETLRYLNQRLVGRLPDEMFVTLFYGLLDLERGTLVYASAGHDPPFLLRMTGRVEELGGTGIALGILAEAGFAERTIALAPGDLLVCYTDGITDLPLPTGERLGAQRLRSLIAGAATQPCAELVQDVARHAGVDGPLEVRDDVTLVAIRYRGPLAG